MAAEGHSLAQPDAQVRADAPPNRLRICLSLDNYDRPHGGAALAARGLAHYLAALGHEIHVLQPGAPGTYHDGAVRIVTRPLRRRYLLSDNDRDTLDWNRQWQGIVGDFLDVTDVDLLITQNRLLYSSVLAARQRRVPAIVWAHAYRIFCTDQFLHHDPLADCAEDCRVCVRGLFSSAALDNRAAYRQGLELADLVIANSNYMARVIAHLVGREAPVVYPTFDLRMRSRPAMAAEQILYAKPIDRKGLPIFVEIARRLGERQFLVAGKISSAARRSLRGLDNVTLTGWSRDMSRLYESSRLVLGPSIWPEPFGRVFAEAAAAGLPSIVSARGGIPEAVGNGAILIDDIDTVGNWLDAISSLDDEARHRKLSLAARQHALTLRPEAVGPALATALAAATGLDLFRASLAN